MNWAFGQNEALMPVLAMPLCLLAFSSVFLLCLYHIPRPLA
ncbi:hypothetical protein [Pseudomonas sp.]